jgi:hypothetical protein
MTPLESALYASAKATREAEQMREQWRMAAQVAAWIMAPWIKNQVTADNLLGIETPVDYLAVKRRIRRTRERFGTA